MKKVIISLLLCTSLFAQESAPKMKKRLDFLSAEQDKVKKMINAGQDDGQLKKYLKELSSESKELQGKLVKVEKKGSEAKKKKADALKRKKEEKKVAAEKKRRADAKKKKALAAKNKKVTKKKVTKTRKKAKVTPLVIKAQVSIDKSKSLREQLTDTLALLDRENDNLILLTESGLSSRARKIASANIVYLVKEKDRILMSLKDKRKKSLSAFSYKGHFQLRNESAKNRQGVQGARQSNQTVYRFRTNFTFSPNENLSFNFTPQAVKGFGNNENGGLTQHSQVDVYEANINYKLTESLTAKIGRQELSYGDHLIIGALPWLNEARSFEGIKLTAEHSLGATDIMYSKTSDNATPLQANDDTNLFTLYNKFSFGPLAKEADLYFFHRDGDTTNAEQELNTIGFRVKGSIKNIFYRTENAMQEGGGVGEDAYQYNVEVGAKVSKFSGSLEYAVAGPDYIQMYPTAHKFLGFADVLGRRNIKHLALHANASLNSWLAVRADIHSFKRKDTTKGAYSLLGTSSLGTNGSSDDIGNELDIVLTFKSKDNIKLQLGGAWFDPGAYMKDQQGNDKMTQFTYAQINASF